jgi:hypothetical protein
MEKVAQETEKSIGDAIRINEKEVGDHLNRLVRQSVEDTINSLLARGGRHMQRRLLPAQPGPPGHTHRLRMITPYGQDLWDFFLSACF